MKTTEVKAMIESGMLDDKLMELYVDYSRLAYQKNRYMKALEEYEKYYDEYEINLFSAPGRSEISGNHTDHQQGKVLAASVNLDAIAVVAKTEDNIIRVVSEGFDMITIPLSDLSYKEEEKETTTALVKGVVASLQKMNYGIGGFQAYITSDVLIGAGLSSSAAFETIIGTIVSHLYNNGRIGKVEIAMAGQCAENTYFGKPCGLMDQMACSVGSMVAIDFVDPLFPRVEQIKFDLNKFGYSLCITDTKGSHADLTADYAAVPKEMKAVAAYFGKEVLAEVQEDEFYRNIPEIRKELGDRAVLRTIHFMEENKRVVKAVDALKKQDVGSFLTQIKESGSSSFKYLQNVYTNADVEHQNLSVALAVSDSILKENGVARVHGGGFAGTIQAFVKNAFVEEYRNRMDGIFGSGACKILKIRNEGGVLIL
ncbi:MAG: galactokinase [Lachnospiraceae bacterium]|nr:galactokinase [Lachnospiraceae bacterium]